MRADAGGRRGFLGELTQEELAAFHAVARTRRFASDSTLFNEGERSDRVMAISAGRVKVSFFTEDGREVVLGLRGPGELLGEFSALDEGPRSATVTALEPVEALVLSVDAFREFILSNPRVALLLLQALSRKLRDADLKRVEFGAFDTVGRVASRVLELAEQYGEETAEGVRIALPISQQELAGWVGASREAVSKALQNLRKREILVTHRKGLIIRDMEALRRRAS